VLEVRIPARAVARGTSVPIYLSSHFVIDLPTLCAVTVFIVAAGGLLMLFCWVQNRTVPALAFWGVGYLLGAVAAGLVALGGLIPLSWSICGASALICCAYGVLWSGARAFEGRQISWTGMMAGAAIWIAACQVPSLYDSLQARLVLTSIILATYTLLGAREVWFARDKELISRWPTLAILVVHAAFILARIPLASTITPLPNGAMPHTAVVTFMAFEALFAAFCIAFLRVNMSKERAEFEQRRAALTDSLTGVANRRAFFDRGGPLLDRLIADRRPAALLLFDLDRFKDINDTSGHQAGDHVLKTFADLIASSTRPSDLFGRLGGEEFACLLVGVSMAEALRTAERLRGEFAAMQFPQLETGATVSIGVAMASDSRGSLQLLLAMADRALYRAKNAGRNCVAPAPLVLVEGKGRGAARPATDFIRADVMAAPRVG
jgi:diguanylate cyclase (GGDEF)-like protein